MALGALAVVALPREEEPQIIVPMVDVFVQMPGATPAEVEQRVTRPDGAPAVGSAWRRVRVLHLEQRAARGHRPLPVGEPEEAALVRLNQKLAANADLIPPGAIGPLVKPRSIDDVPILAVTLWSPRYDDFQLRTLAAQLRDAIAEVPDVSEVTTHRRPTRQLRVTIDPARLAAYGLDPPRCWRPSRRANVQTAAPDRWAGPGHRPRSRRSPALRSTTSPTSWSPSRGSRALLVARRRRR